MLRRPALDATIWSLRTEAIAGDDFMLIWRRFSDSPSAAIKERTCGK
jgi:hypothetical protein